jgi:hypothetical protein
LMELARAGDDLSGEALPRVRRVLASAGWFGVDARPTHGARAAELEVMVDALLDYDPRVRTAARVSLERLTKRTVAADPAAPEAQRESVVRRMREELLGKGRD